MIGKDQKTKTRCHLTISDAKTWDFFTAKKTNNEQGLIEFYLGL
jgi:hypothetical protein